MKFLYILSTALCLSTSAFARDYACEPWDASQGKTPNIQSISVLKSMVVIKSGGTSTTIRMNYGTLTRNTYIDDTSAIVVYGKPTKNAEGTLGFGNTITVQRIQFDPNSPTVMRTTCEAPQ